MTAVSYEAARHATILAFAACFGLIDAAGRTVGLEELVTGDVDDAIRAAAHTNGVVPELADYSDRIAKIYSDEQLTKILYDTATAILRRYGTEPSTREVHATYGEAAASAVRTLDAIDPCDNCDTLAELFAATDNFLRLYADTLTDVFAAVITANIALVSTPQRRGEVIHTARESLNEQNSYVTSTRDQLDRMRQHAETLSDDAARATMITDIRAMIVSLEAHLLTIMDDAQALRDRAVAHIRMQNQIVDNHTIPAPVDGRHLAGVL